MAAEGGKQTRAGDRGGTHHRALSLSCALGPPAPRRSPHPPHGVPLRVGPIQAGAEVLPAAGAPQSRGFAVEVRTRSGATAAAREPAAPGKCAASPHHPCRRPVQAPGWEGLPEGSREGRELHCAQPRGFARIGVGSCGLRYGAQGSFLVALWGPAPVVGTLIRLLLLGFHLPPRVCNLSPLGLPGSLRILCCSSPPLLLARGGSVGLRESQAGEPMARRAFPRSRDWDSGADCGEQRRRRS